MQRSAEPVPVIATTGGRGGPPDAINGLTGNKGPLAVYVGGKQGKAEIVTRVPCKVLADGLRLPKSTAV